MAKHIPRVLTSLYVITFLLAFALIFFPKGDEFGYRGIPVIYSTYLWYFWVSKLYTPEFSYVRFVPTIILGGVTNTFFVYRASKLLVRWTKCLIA